MSSGPSRPDEAPSKTARSSSPSPSKSAISTAATEPSLSRVTKTRSKIRMIPRSTRSTSNGNPSPVIRLPGNSTTR